MTQAPPPASPDAGVASIVHKNVRELLEHRQAHERRKTKLQRLADRVSDRIGSVPFLILQILVVGLWVLNNSRHLASPVTWDAYPFPTLSLFVSAEALFISLFILISQNQSHRLTRQRSELNLQINLLTEHEITRLIGLTEELLKKAGASDASAPDLHELKQPSSPQAIIQALEKVDDEAPRGAR